MKAITSWIHPERPGIAAALLLTAFSFAVAGAATATPLYFTGPSNFGTTEAQVLTAQGADASLGVIDIGDLGFPLSNAGGVGLPNPTCASAPSDPSCLDLEITIPASFLLNESSSPSISDPTFATSTWQVQNTSGLELANAYLVFVSSFGAVTNNPGLVGIDPDTSLDNYIIFNFGSGIGEIYYATIELGALGIDEITTAVVRYVVADGLIPGQNMNMLPVLVTQASIIASVPEPGVFTLFASGLAVLGAVRRRQCT